MPVRINLSRPAVLVATWGMIRLMLVGRPTMSAPGLLIPQSVAILLAKRLRRAVWMKRCCRPDLWWIVFLRIAPSRPNRARGKIDVLGKGPLAQGFADFAAVTIFDRWPIQSKIHCLFERATPVEAG